MRSGWVPPLLPRIARIKNKQVEHLRRIPPHPLGMAGEAEYGSVSCFGVLGRMGASLADTLLGLSDVARLR